MRHGEAISDRLRPACAAILLLALAAPASAKVVEFTAVYRAGLGDGGNPTTTVDLQPNGLPICNRGNVAHLDASVPAHGFLQVASGAAPQSIMDFRPYKYGTAGATGSSPTSAMPGVAGLNGAARFATGTCDVDVQPSLLPPNVAFRRQRSRFTWPANYTAFTTPVPTVMGASAPRVLVGTGQEAHTVAPGGGPGTFNVVANATKSQFVSGMAGPNTFGGGFRASGGGRVDVIVPTIGGNNATGYWLTGPRMIGHNAPTPTQMVTRSGSFTTSLASLMFPVTVRAWNLPFTTGTVRAEDHGGQFTTIRTAMGADNRTPMGEMGTLLLVTPWAANITALDLYFGGTASLEFTFLPEPGATAMLVVSVLWVWAMGRGSRRRS